MEIKLAILAAAIAGAFIAGAAGGWAVNGWRLGKDVAQLEGVRDTQVQTIETLTGANQRCTASVADVKGAVKGYVDAGDKATKAALEAMKRAEAAAQGHLAAAKEAMNRPPAPPGKECETVAAEAGKYARKRKGAP